MKKCYIFVHRSLSGIYAGIQAAHAVAEHVYDYHGSDSVIHWTNHHKTMVVLDGGNSKNMERVLETLGWGDEGVSYFREPDMDNMITAIVYIPSDDEMNDIEAAKESDYSCMEGGIIDLLVNSRTHKG